MKKRDYAILATKNGMFKQSWWMFSVFAIAENQEKPKPFSIKREAGKVYFLNAEGTEWVVIDDAKVDDPLFVKGDQLEIVQGDIPNLKEAKLTTTYRKLVFNWIVLVWPFGDKIDYIQKDDIGPDDIESLIEPRLTDDSLKDKGAKPDAIFVSEYLKFTESVDYLTTFTTLFVPGVTTGAIIISPQVKELRDKLLKEYADQLTDPAILAKIDAELIALDKKVMADDPAAGFLIDKKSYSIVRKKLFYMLGAEEGFKESTSVDPVTKSLAEGWDVEKFPTMMSIQRAGSYNRGAETALGGEQVKWMLRASSNVRITVDDCGSTTGMPRMVSEKNIENFIGMTAVENGNNVFLTDDNIKSYVGKRIYLRSPMFCKLESTDFCRVCVGARLAEHPTGASAAVAKYGDVFLSLFMKKMHGNMVSVAELDLNDTLG